MEKSLVKRYFYQALEENPIIAAIKNMDDLELCCSIEEIRVVFVLFGDICTIRTIVKRLKDAGKIVIVHVDLIVGLSSKERSWWTSLKCRQRQMGSLVQRSH